MKYSHFTPTQDWHKYFEALFDATPIHSMVEFGLGVGTEFFLDRCDRAVSIEISLGDYNKQWYDKSLQDYAGRKNWEPHYLPAPEEIHKSNELAIANRHPIDYDGHIPKLQTIFALYVKNPDFIFIDAGFHNRGELVNLSFGKAPIIAAHDTSRDESRVIKNIYGYNIVSVPDNYEEFHFEDTYMGTTIWVEKTEESAIKALQLLS